MKKANTKETREAILNYLKKHKDPAHYNWCDHNKNCDVYKGDYDDGLADCECFLCDHDEGHCTYCHDDCDSDHCGANRNFPG